MTMNERWLIDAVRRGDGCIFIFFAGEDELFPGLRALSVHLFAWHEESYFGTLLEDWSDRGRHGFLLSASDSIGYWYRMPTLRHGAEIEWGAGARQLMEAAKLLNRALAEGWFVPALVVSENGAVLPGWRLLRAEESHPDAAFTARCEQLGWAALDRQLTDVLGDLTIDPKREAGAAFLHLKAVHPAAMVLEKPGTPVDFLDEVDLWEAVGFRADKLPFTVGLRLEEPTQQDGVWRLTPWICERAEIERGYACDWFGHEREADSAADERWPVDQVAEQLERRRKRWLALVPDLLESWDIDRAWTFLEQDSVVLMARGVHILLPAWWEEFRKSKPAAVAKLRPGAGSSGLLGKDQLLAFDWALSIGQADLSLETFKSAVRNDLRLVRHGERWMALHPRWIKLFQQFLRKMGKRDHLTLSETIEMYLSGGHEVALAEDGETDLTAATRESSMSWQVQLNAPVAEWLARLEDQEQREGAKSLPASLKPILRDYQSVGASWLLSLRHSGFGACLADDMGLGKTLQFIAYLAALKEREELASPGLIVCPTSVIGNWQKELERFAPQLNVYLHYGSKREQGEAFALAINGSDLVITSYALANSDVAFLREMSWSVIGLDEAQNIKNPHGKQSLAVRSLEAGHRVALTGTPIENRLSELWAIYDFINPAYLGSQGSFQKRFGWLDKSSADEQKSTRRLEGAQQLQRIIRPFLLRRLKSDPAIQLGLPEKNESLVYIPLTVEQGALYEAELQAMLDKIERMEPMERRGLILATLGRLKQICDHPALLMKEADAEVAAAAHEEVAQVGKSEAGKAAKMRGSFKSAAARSHKLSRLLEMAGEVLEEGRKGIIFTQFIGMGHLLQEVLESALGCRVDFLHGGVPREERDRMVSRLQSDGTGEAHSDFLILSIKAGGTGLNLTAASHVFHYDRWWNPAVEDQATDRAHRIGQTRDVQVHKFVALGTVEERIDEMIRQKKSLSDQIIGGGEQWITELSTEELKELFALRREWVRD